MRHDAANAARLDPAVGGARKDCSRCQFITAARRRYKQIRDTIVGTTPAGYLGCTAAIRNYDFVPKLPSVKMPVLVVCGADDAGTPPEANRRIASLVANGRYEQIASARHFPNVEHPETFNHIMMSWLRSVIA